MRRLDRPSASYFMYMQHAIEGAFDAGARTPRSPRTPSSPAPRRESLSVEMLEATNTRQPHVLARTQSPVRVRHSAGETSPRGFGMSTPRFDSRFDAGAKAQRAEAQRGQASYDYDYNSEPKPSSFTAQREARDGQTRFATHESMMLPSFLQSAQQELDQLLGTPLRPPRAGGGYAWPHTANEKIWAWWMKLAGPWAVREVS